MTGSEQFGQEEMWHRIDQERDRDKALRRVSSICWGITFFILFLLTIRVGFELWRVLGDWGSGLSGTDRFFIAFNTLTPLLGVVGGISLLVATLSTVGVFLRLRTASLGEIQLRLAALEEMLLSKQIEELD